MTLPFAKMHGAGNDFVVLRDDASLFPLDDPALARRVCSPHVGLVCEGLIVLRRADAPEGTDFRMVFLNPDGSRAAMCGNGGRCLARFAAERGRAPWGASRLETDVGLLGVETRVGGDPVTVRLELPTPTCERLAVPVEAGGGIWVFHALDTGVPHAVHFLPPGADPGELETLDVVGIGRAVRHAPEFAPAGTNVDFVRVASGGDTLEVRTYERGVEDETGACGTGAVASAVLARRLGLVDGPAVRVVPRSGLELTVDFRDGAAPHLTGPAEIAYFGHLP